MLRTLRAAPFVAGAFCLSMAYLANAQTPPTPAETDYSQSILNWLSNQINSGFPSIGMPPFPGINNYPTTFYVGTQLTTCTPGILPCPEPCPGVFAYVSIVGHVVWLDAMVHAIHNRMLGCVAGFTQE